MKEEIIAGLDIGSTNIRLVIGQKATTPEGEEWQVIGAVSSPSSGISKGSISSIEDATSSISACIEKAERLIGMPLTSVLVAINNPRIKCDKSNGVVVVSKGDGEIDVNDVERAVEASKSLMIPNNYEILHAIPIKFAIDNQEDIKDPIGMSGIRLEAQTLIIMGLSNQINNLTKAVHRTRLDIDDLILAPWAQAEAVLDSKQKELGVAVVNIGATTTSLAVYEDGDILHTAILPIGSEHITSDIAIGLRCPINLAERIKIELGDSEPSNYGKKDDVDISELVREERINDSLNTVPRKYLAEIIEARVEEIFEKVDEELRKIDRSGMLPAGILLTGAGSQLVNMVETAKRKLRLPVSLGEPRNIRLAIDKARQPEFLTALGLVVWGVRYNSARDSGGAWKNNVGQMFGWVGGLFKKMMPQ